MFEESSLSKTAVIYFLFILCIGVFLLIHEIRSKKKCPHLVPTSKADWFSFGLLMWALIMLTFIVQNIWALVPSTLPYPWTHVSLGFSLQLTILAFIVVSALYYPRLFDFPVSRKETSTSYIITQGVLCFLTALPIVWFVNLSWIGVTKLWGHFGFIVELQQQELVKLFAESRSPLLLIAIILFGVIIAPITEEFIFRAGVYRFLKSKMNGLLALAISALLFAWVHHNLLSFLPLFLLGLLLGRSYEKTGSIITPIVFHGLFNANSLIILLMDPKLNAMSS